MITHLSATVCACGYEIDADEERQYIDGEALCTACRLEPDMDTELHWKGV
ncbi:hypothetical protein [Streptomyces sp. NRRL F-4489]|nr:hypothetical protein [Streptomyces sp. NRRL F-4489]